MKSFLELKVNKTIIENLNKNNIINPTLVQESFIPLALSNYDILAKAPTGTGKTAAFAIPIVQKLIEEDKKFNARALILSPTRELALQISNTFKFIGKSFDLKICSIIGGESMGRQIRSLHEGLDIIVATPGRLVDLIRQNKVNLSDVKYFVLDETDLILDMGFIRDIQTIKNKLPKEIQSFLVSATIPKEIKNLSEKMLKQNHKYIETNLEEKNKNNIKQYICHIDSKDKPKILVDLIKNNLDKSFIVFINTKKISEYISRFLNENKIRSQVIHGDKSQVFRSKAISAFKTKRSNILIATDVASRGIHIDNVNFVINYDVPNNKDTYVHRIGRTGRANNKGVSYTFCTKNDFIFLKEIIKLKNNAYEISQDEYCMPINWDEVKNSKSEQSRRLPRRSMNSEKKYFNDKSYETKRDQKRKHGIEKFNERVKYKKYMDEFKWGQKNNDDFKQNSTSNNSFSKNKKGKINKNENRFSKNRRSRNNNRYL